MKIFSEIDLTDFIEEKRSALAFAVQAEDKNNLLNVNECKYVEYLVEHFSIDPVVLHWDQMSVSDHQAMIPAEMFPRDFHVIRGNYYPRQIIIYHIPYSGEQKLLKCSPFALRQWSLEIELKDGCVCFDLTNWRDDPEEIKRGADNVISHLRQQVESITTKVVLFNSQLEGEARQHVQARKSLLLKQEKLIASLGVPFHKTQKVPSTFAVPVIAKKILIKPSAPSSAYIPEPTLDESIYHEILQIIYHTGIEMERHQSIYHGKGEEPLRDYFIMVLSPHFQSVTGETFNKSGKTDILIRHEKHNVFVAECKFWKGIEKFYETIDQLLGYLTWRDSKSAIICFVKNKELNPVLQQIESETAKHPCFVKYYGKKAESWFSFEFHLKEDQTRSVKLALLCFHLP